jgi:ankyrin repeat protein
MQAVSAEQVEMIRTLLEHGANAAAKTPAGLTALDIAKKRNLTAIAAMLE